MSDKTRKDMESVKFYRGLAHAENPEQFDELRSDEFPSRKGLLEIDRRSVLKVMGGAAVLAGLSAAGCRYIPQKKIIPFVQQPENAQSGKNVNYASSYEVAGYGVGVLVSTVDGHPVRLDGHPDHPVTQGSLDARTMALPVSLWDPDRLTAGKSKGDMVSWESAMDDIHQALEGKYGGTAILTEAVGSPTMASQMKKLLARFPGLKWYQWEPASADNARDGLQALYGEDVLVTYDFTKADTIVSIDSNLMQEGPMSVRYMRDITSRRVPTDTVTMNRIYAVESVPTTLGVTSDHRIRLRATAMPTLLRYIAGQLGVAGSSASLPSGLDPNKVAAMLDDLKLSGSKSVVVVGDHLPPEAHALAALINTKLASVVMQVGPPVLANPVNYLANLRDLTAGIAKDEIASLIIIGGNPVYSAPADLQFDKAMQKLHDHSFSAHLTTESNETSQYCYWQLPRSHMLEAWGDTIAPDGTIAITQPVIETSWDTKSDVEFIDLLLDQGRTGIEIVKEAFATYHSAPAATVAPPVATPAATPAKTTTPPVSLATPPGPNGTPPTRLTIPAVDDSAWDSYLSAGMIPPKPSTKTFAPKADAASLSRTNQSAGLELVFMPDPSLYDGRYANNSWLQELPKPMNHLVWDNALFMSFATAKKLNVGQPQYVANVVPYLGPSDVVTVKVGKHTLDVPVYVNLGQADDVLMIYLGGGRTAGGDVAVASSEDHGGGFNASVLRTTAMPWIATDVTVTKANKGYLLVSTQYHNMLDSSRMDADRGLIFETTPKKLKEGKPFGDEAPERAWANPGEGIDKTPPSFYDDEEFQNNKISAENYQWAMTIDLSKCTGCNACVISCQAENNIPVVGKAQAKVHRAMHWIRIDKYFKGYWKDDSPWGDAINKDDPPMYFQPIPCMQCENAPCEPVCPVAATTHSHEGLNQMVYNRCVGTRYCSNNCPYKVRRFNFLHYTKKVDEVPILRMLQNPEVTVRGRGVMEKCTYCVQRINKARQTAKVEGRRIKDGEVVTACQQACPAQVITFGDKQSPRNKVAQTRKDPRSYVLLEELNTRPRTTYMARVSNPNPRLEGEKA